MSTNTVTIKDFSNFNCLMVVFLHNLAPKDTQQVLESIYLKTGKISDDFDLHKLLLKTSLWILNDKEKCSKISGDYPSKDLIDNVKRLYEREIEGVDINPDDWSEARLHARRCAFIMCDQALEEKDYSIQKRLAAIAEMLFISASKNIGNMAIHAGKNSTGVNSAYYKQLARKFSMFIEKEVTHQG